MFAGSALLTLQWTPPCGVIRATHHRVPNTENEFDSNFFGSTLSAAIRVPQLFARIQIKDK